MTVHLQAGSGDCVETQKLHFSPCARGCQLSGVWESRTVVEHNHTRSLWTWMTELLCRRDPKTGVRWS